MTRAAAALVLLALSLVFPLPAEPTFRLCGFHWLTGRDCPFCGLTRALFAFAKGTGARLSALTHSAPWHS